MKKSILLMLSVVLGFTGAFADEGPYLDPDYLQNPEVRERQLRRIYTQEEIQAVEEQLDEPISKVDHLQTALAQTPVKSQGRRGTCSMFSSTAILEYNLKQIGVTSEDLDLSEQWIEYITAGQRGQEGSWSYYNFDEYGQWGFLNEEDWTYNKNTWYPYNESYWQGQATALEQALYENECLSYKDNNQHLFDGCLIGQKDPAYLGMSAQELQENDFAFWELREKAGESIETMSIYSRSLWSNADVQFELDQGNVVALDVTFFYEAWNHGRGSSLGLSRSTDLWAQGKVSYPDRNSKDYVESRKSDNRAGHSVVLVGYDPNYEWTRTVEDRNGQMMDVTTKGVYYFKNSWGADSPTSFGAEFELDGQKLPGFGMISMEYAHEHGTFYQMIIEPFE